MAVKESQIDEIRKSADIVEIISSYVPLTLKGKNYFGVCPFHQDHSPSMSVSKERQLYKCFSCGAGGNVFNFVKEYENVSFLESVSIVANKIGMNFTNNYQKPKEEHEEEFKIMQLASLFYQNNLQSKEAKRAKEYLHSRNITDEMILTFHLGLALEDNSLGSLLEKKNYQNDLLENLGLIRKSGLDYHDVFSNRIIFPIENPDGKVVAFTGRVYLKDATPKYLNSKETILFKKGNVLYNYHRAKEKVRLMKKVILVEGNMDAMRMYSMGFYNTIALMGTSLTKEQIDLIKKLRVPLTLMLDNDDAGKINTYNNGVLLEEAGIDIDVVRLSKAKDPDEFLINYGKEQMEECLKHPISFLEFKLAYLKENKNLADSKELVKYIKDVLKVLEKSDELEQEITIKKLAKDYDLSYDLLKSELSKNEKKVVDIPIKQEIERPKKNKYEMCANAILYYMMNDVKYLKMYQKKLNYFSLKKYRQIASEVLYYFEKHKTINLADFLSYVETSPIKDDIKEVINSIKEKELTDAKMEEYIKSMKRIMIDEEIKELKLKQKNSFDESEKNEIAIKITELKKDKEKL